MFRLEYVQIDLMLCTALWKLALLMADCVMAPVIPLMSAAMPSPASWKLYC